MDAGAPQSGLSRLIWRIRFRVSWETASTSAKFSCASAGPRRLQRSILRMRRTAEPLTLLRITLNQRDTRHR